MKKLFCTHPSNHTTTVSLDVAYYIECLDCGRQFSEQEWSDYEEARYANMKEAEATGN